jgi:hypothetical protein
MHASNAFTCDFLLIRYDESRTWVVQPMSRECIVPASLDLYIRSLDTI